MLLRKIHCTLSVFLLSAMALVSTGCDSHSRPVPDYDENTKVIALTFDDGPNTNTTVEILDILEKYGVVASFFVIGNNVTEETAPIVKRAYDMGCEINNHSLTHSNMISFSEEELLSEISQTSDKVEEITGEPTHFFRPPYIAVDGDMFTTIEEENLGKNIISVELLETAIYGEGIRKKTELYYVSTLKPILQKCDGTTDNCIPRNKRAENVLPYLNKAV